jgi:NitT/TauT family transport system substrate-binding protein
MRKLLAPIAVVLLIALTACQPSGGPSSSASGSAAGTPVNVGVPPTVDAAPLYLGEAQGFFTRHHIDVELVPLSGATTAIEGLNTIGLQFSFADVGSVIQAASQDVPLRVVAEGASSTGDPATDFSSVVVPADSLITSARDLAGKTVAVTRLRTVGDVAVRDAVAKDGADPKSVKFVELAFSDMSDALASHQVDAAWLVEPYVTAATAKGARIVSSPFCSVPDLTSGVYVTTPSYLEEHGDVVDDFRRAVEESLRYASQHPDDVRDILRTYADITARDAPAVKVPAFPQDIDVESLKEVSSLMDSYGFTRGLVDVTSVLAAG